MEIEIVRTARRLDEIGDAWNALAARAGSSVFQSHDWISAWWRATGSRERHRMCIAVAWQHERMIAVAPMTVRSYYGLRLLQWAAKNVSDRCDVVVDPDIATGALPAMWTALGREPFDLAYLSHVAPQALIASAALSRSACALVRSSRAEVNLSVQARWPNGDAWLRSLPKKARNNYTRGKRILRESGALTTRIIGPDEDYAAALDGLIALKEAWARSNRLTAPILANSGAPLRALAAVLAARGLMQLVVMECDGRLIGGSLNFLENGTLNAFFAAFDPAYERASPGTVLMVEYITWALDHGIETIDFLTGGEDYKFKFATTHQELRAFVGARTWRGWMALAADRTRTAWNEWSSGPTVPRVSRPVMDLPFARAE